MSVRCRNLCLLAFCWALPTASAEPAPPTHDSPIPSASEPTGARFTGPWEMERLKQGPRFEWGETQGDVREVLYEGEMFRGQPTRVFAYYARPKQGNGPFPAMVLVHGGGGQAFAEWANLWAQRGYAALAMDLAGCGPGGKRLADGGPDQRHEDKFLDFDSDSLRDVWTYQAVAAVIRGHSLLAGLPEVDADRIGITGISWGGYLTCIVAGVDDRLKVAVPVYGCGFLDKNSCWLSIFDQMSPEQRQRWVRSFDPSQYLPGVSCPILFVNGTNDFAYPLDSYQRSYRAVHSPRQLCVRVRMPHGHQAGWQPIEIGLFVDSVLKHGVPLAKWEAVTLDAGQLRAKVKAELPIVQAELHYAPDEGPWKEREWNTVSASHRDGQVHVDLPKQRPLVAFLTVSDQRGAVASTEHVRVP